MALRDVSVKTKVMMIPLISLLFMAIMFFLESTISRSVSNEVQLSQFGKAVLDGSKELLKVSVDVQAISLGQMVEGITDQQQLAETIINHTDSLRFFDDNSGYFFTYTLDGTRINNPPDKSKNGSNYLDFKDKKGNYLFQNFAKVIRQSGGGYVEYFWEKPGKGIQPKLSYVKLIPGTDIYVGCGVYIDNVESEKAALFDKVKQENAKYNVVRYSMWGGIILLSLLSSIAIIRSIVSPLTMAIKNLIENADSISQSSRQVAQASQYLADGSSEQAAAVDHTSSSIEDLAVMTKNNAESAEQANSLASESNSAAQQGSQAMSQMMTAITEMQLASEEVSKIIKVIDEIAFQTNLLALNAAVEAARAGESGKGFAVVAEEVRNLAMRSAEAAHSTAELIEQSVKSSNISSEVVSHVEDAFKLIVEKSNSLTDIIAKIDSSCHEQASGLDRINLAMAQIDKVTQTNAASSEESASASKELSDQASIATNVVAELRKQVGS